MVHRLALSAGTASILTLLGVLVACNADSSGSATASGSGGGSASGNGGTSAGGFNLNACFSCGEVECTTQAGECESTNGCRDMLECMFGCDSADQACLQGCVPSGATDAALAATSFYACGILACTEDCVPAVDTSNSGVGGSAVTAATSAGTGAANGLSAVNTVSTTVSNTTSSSTTVSNTTSSSTTVNNSTSSSTTGQPPTGDGISWVTFEGDWADPALAANSSLNISGAIYSYTDGCATATWDAATRCVYGTLCDPGADFANWGMAVAFDFYNTGMDGDPPDTKLVWDANAVAATGLAWRVTGTAPGLQVWVTNMDASFGGQCAVDECAIDGPPDGVASTPLNAVAQMPFASMVKDDWGGSGTVYSFDPSAILGLQFKMASIASGAASFDFCVEDIGIIVP